MILDDLPQPASTGVDATLDDLFRAAAARRPDAIALRDPPNRASFTDGAARQLTYAQADRMVAAIAARLRELNVRRRRGGRAADRQHGRGRAHLAGGAARRADRHAAAAVVAAGRRHRGHPAMRRQRADRERAHRGDRPFRSRGQCRGRSLHGAPGLRLRPPPSRRRDLAGRSRRGARHGCGRSRRARRRARTRRASGCRHLGRGGGRTGPGRPQPCPAHRRRACGPAREPHSAECRHPVHALRRDRLPAWP